MAASPAPDELSAKRSARALAKLERIMRDGGNVYVTMGGNFVVHRADGRFHGQGATLEAAIVSASEYAPVNREFCGFCETAPCECPDGEGGGL